MGQRRTKGAREDPQVTAVPDTAWAPAPWRGLLAELNGRAPDGAPGVRDVDAPCD